MSVYLYLKNYSPKRLEGEMREEKNSYKRFNNYLRKNEEGYFSYKRIEKYLKKLGNPLELTPFGYIIGKLLIPVILFIAFLISNDYILAVISAAFGYFILDIILKTKDKQDMRVIKLELGDVYDLLNIQTTAGVFIGNALTECYLVASNKRFKMKLAELSAEINMTKNIEKALDNFQSNFNSSEIDNFVITIKQSLITGQTEEALEDISDSLKERNLIAIQEDTKKVNSTANIIQLLMYMGIMTTILYITGAELIKSWTGIFIK